MIDFFLRVFFVAFDCRMIAIKPQDDCERSSDRAIERASDRAIERSSDRAIERATERAIEQASDRAMERAIERWSDRAIDKSKQSKPKLELQKSFDKLTSAFCKTFHNCDF